MKNKEVLVIGAGITGLAAAWKLAESGVSVTVIEKENFVGGLAATIDWDGWKFDFGPHNFHTNDNSIIEFYQDKLPGKFKKRDLKVQLYIFFLLEEEQISLCLPQHLKLCKAV